MIRVNPAGAAPPPAADKLARLKETSGKLEGVFVDQMFKAMRETVPQDGVADGGQGEEIFSSMFDEKLADQVPAQWHRGIADALYRELQGRVAPETK